MVDGRDVQSITGKLIRVEGNVSVIRALLPGDIKNDSIYETSPEYGLRLYEDLQERFER